MFRTVNRRRMEYETRIASRMEKNSFSLMARRKFMGSRLGNWTREWNFSTSGTA
jgi:hypothetical protein